MEEALKLKRATYHLWTFTISKMISALGANVYAFGVSLYILALTGSATSFAANMICSVLPRTLLAPVVGYVADNYPKKPTILLAQAGSVLAVGGLLLYSAFFDLTLWAFYITTALYSITSVFSGVTFSSSIANLIDGERIQKAMSFNQASMSIAAIGGPAIGGMLFGFVSIKVFLVIHMVAYLTALILEATMDFNLYSKRAVTKEGEEKKKEGVFESMKAGFSYLKKHRVVSVIVWVALWLNFFFAVVNVGGTYVIVEVLKIDPKHFGIIEAAGACGMLIASIYFSTRKPVKYPLQFSKHFILGMAVLVGLLTIPLFVKIPYFGIVAFFLIMFVGFSALGVFANTPIGVMMQTEVDEAYRGRVFGILETMAMGMMPIGMVLFGFLFDQFPAQWIFISTSLILIMIILYMLRPSVLKQAHPELGKTKPINVKATEKVQQV